MEIDPVEAADVSEPANRDHARLNTWVAITVALLATFMWICKVDLSTPSRDCFRSVNHGIGRCERCNMMFE